MSNMADDLDQGELDALLSGAIYEHTGGDSRYSMRLEDRGGAFYLVIEGMVLQPTPDEFIERIDRILGSVERRGVVIDLRSCTYLSSTVLSHLVRFFDTSLKHQSQVVLLEPKPKIRSIVELLGLTELFLMVENEEMATRFFQKQGLL
jgi:anti-anti-sigma factor